MASHPYLNSSNQLRNYCSTYTPRRAYSKAQICFFNILHIISSIPPSPNSKPQPCLSPGDDDRSGTSFSSGNKGIGVDLNLRFCSVADSEEEEEQQQQAREKSVEISDAQVHSFKVDNIGVDHEEAKSEESEQDSKGSEGETVPFAWKRHEGKSFCDSNCLDMLIEAAKLVSAKDESNSEEASQGTGALDLEIHEHDPIIKKRRQRWVIVDLCSEMVDTSPVVRSKRGRNQALPYRFRDSVLEPLKRSNRPSSTRKRLIGS